jgi:hypothetical protein
MYCFSCGYWHHCFKKIYVLFLIDAFLDEELSGEVYDISPLAIGLESIGSFYIEMY